MTKSDYNNPKTESNQPLQPSHTGTYSKLHSPRTLSTLKSLRLDRPLVGLSRVLHFRDPAYATGSPQEEQAPRNRKGTSGEGQVRGPRCSRSRRTANSVRVESAKEGKEACKAEWPSSGVACVSPRQRRLLPTVLIRRTLDPDSSLPAILSATRLLRRRVSCFPPRRASRLLSLSPFPTFHRC